MPLKVAIASSDGKSIDLHFGQAPDFLIFEIKENGDSKFIEARKNIPPSDDPNLLENHDNALAKSVDLISDCDVVLASQIGPSASKAILSCSVQSYSIRGLLIEKALKKLASSKLVSKPVPRPIIH
ncbi:NifB/NifX family molybdenum-iron cluster-binding protein [Methanobacterium sp. MBAC-LM]|uniref:NifB/NifX family molybdenum-iron cluster-binding protein n=1 Tax=Methanobacterium sp. MBAC-LM TaxID=3412034 RepID=UPI003C744CDF